MGDAPNWLLPAISIFITVISVSYMAGRLTGTYATKEEVKALEEKLRDKLESIKSESAVQHQNFVPRKEFEDSERELRSDIKEIKEKLDDLKDTLTKFTTRFGSIKSANS